MGTGASSYIDVAAAQKLGIEVRTIKGYGDVTVAEHALALMFDCGRQTARMDRALRGGSWRTLDGVEFAGKTLGVVGTGGVGREMVRLGTGIGMNVIAWNRSGVPADLACTPAKTLDALLAEIPRCLASSRPQRRDQGHHRRAPPRPDAPRCHADQHRARRGHRRAGPGRDHAGLAGFGQPASMFFADEPIDGTHPLAQLENVTLTSHAAFMTAEASYRLLRIGAWS